MVRTPTCTINRMKGHHTTMPQKSLGRRAGGVNFKWIKVIEGGYIDLGTALVGTRCNAAEQDGWCHHTASSVVDGAYGYSY